MRRLSCALRCLLVWTALASLAGQASAEAPPPNIVFILADDLGYVLAPMA